MRRRHFLTTAALAGSGAAAPDLGAASGSDPHIATNVYPWMTFYRRRGKGWGQDLAADLAAVAATGVDGFEPIGDSPDQVRALGPLLREHGLEMRSLYLNAELHEEAEADGAIAHALAVAQEAKKLGTKIIVVNPTPIRWGGPENKSDAELTVQAEGLDRLGAELREGGLTLAYHNHDAELREGAREFHHMLTATSPDNVKFCLDAHWVFRGCGDSQVAVFDALEHYCQRVVELHLRQSQGGAWNEVFHPDGDIGYRRIVDRLDERGVAPPHLVLEQAVEDRSPDTMDAVEAHRKGRENVARMLGQPTH